MSIASRSTKPRGAAARTRLVSLSVMNQSVSLAPSSEKSGRDVDGEREDDRVVEEPDHALNDADPPHPGRGHVGVGTCEGAADHERLVDELRPAGSRLSRKFEPPRDAVGDGGVIDAGIVDGEHD